jgi:hypothetical protein
MAKVNTSLNDISYRQIIRKLTNGIEQINSHRCKDNPILIDSHLMQSERTSINIKTMQVSDQKQHLSHTQDKDRDNLPVVVEFDGIHWIRQDDG